jgi:hypothetical protein
MCVFKSLFRTKEGYVVQCQDCGQFQLAFGNIVLSFSKEAFFQFSNQISNELEFKRETSTSLWQKSILIRTGSPTVRLAFSMDELAKLKEMMEIAQAEWAVSKFLDEC